MNNKNIPDVYKGKYLSEVLMDQLTHKHKAITLEAGTILCYDSHLFRSVIYGEMLYDYTIFVTGHIFEETAHVSINLVRGSVLGKSYNPLMFKEGLRVNWSVFTEHLASKDHRLRFPTDEELDWYNIQKTV